MAHGGRNEAIVHIEGRIQSSLVDLGVTLGEGGLSSLWMNQTDAAFPQS